LSRPPLPMQEAQYLGKIKQRDAPKESCWESGIARRWEHRSPREILGSSKKMKSGHQREKWRSQSPSQQLQSKQSRNAPGQPNVRELAQRAANLRGRASVMLKVRRLARPPLEERREGGKRSKSESARVCVIEGGGGNKVKESNQPAVGTGAVRKAQGGTRKIRRMASSAYRTTEVRKKKHVRRAP